MVTISRLWERNPALCVARRETLSRLSVNADRLPVQPMFPGPIVSWAVSRYAAPDKIAAYASCIGGAVSGSSCSLPSTVRYPNAFDHFGDPLLLPSDALRDADVTFRIVFAARRQRF